MIRRVLQCYRRSFVRNACSHDDFSSVTRAFGWNGELRSMVFADDGTITTPANSVDESRSKIIESSSRDQVTGSLPLHEKAKVMQLLGQWEEPKRASDPRQVRFLFNCLFNAKLRVLFSNCPPPRTLKPDKD